jgi:hypothetical protein
MTVSEPPVPDASTERVASSWWLCPNTPPCPHTAVVHDIYDWGDPAPTCCIDGCTCPAVSP